MSKKIIFVLLLLFGVASCGTLSSKIDAAKSSPVPSLRPDIVSRPGMPDIQTQEQPLP